MRTFVPLNRKDGIRPAVDEAWARKETLEEYKASVCARKHPSQKSLNEKTMNEVSFVGSDQAAYVTSLAMNILSGKESH